MIVDSMNRLELYLALLNDLKQNAVPYVHNNRSRWDYFISTRSKRTRRIITLPWEEYDSPNHIHYHIGVSGDGKTFEVTCIPEFEWNGKKCFALFLDNMYVCVLQKHAIDRYAERILKKDMAARDVAYKFLFKNLRNSFHTVLPSPTHKYTMYLMLAGGLFLGDAENRKYAPNVLSGVWFNTCISFNQAGLSQTRMMTLLKEKKEADEAVGYCPESCPIWVMEELRKGIDAKRLMYIKKSLLIACLFDKLQLSFNIPHIDEEAHKFTLSFTRNFFVKVGISEDELDAFIRNNINIVKEEISFRG